ncbi:MAG: hypothetical protein R3F02_03060 [Thiolinea sp.]
MKTSRLLSVLSGLLVSGLLATQSVSAADVQVYSIEQLCIRSTPNNNTETLISAQATVTSSGWSKLQLMPFVYVRQPDDGVQDYGLVAQQPEGVTMPVMSSLSGDMTILRAGWMKGIRVHTDQNALQLMFDSDEVCVTTE